MVSAFSHFHPVVSAFRRIDKKCLAHPNRDHSNKHIQRGGQQERSLNTDRRNQDDATQ
jgi:hypothetical protein